MRLKVIAPPEGFSPAGYHRAGTKLSQRGTYTPTGRALDRIGLYYSALARLAQGYVGEEKSEACLLHNKTKWQLMRALKKCLVIYCNNSIKLIY
jgi:hypothetical protein